MASTGIGSATKPALISAALFQQDQFMARQKIFSLVPSFYFHDQQGNALAFLRKKVFTWRDEIRVFTDENQSMELLQIKARKIIDWGTAFDVTDSINHQRVGALKRRAWKSLIRKEWTIMDANDQEIGRIQEDSVFLASGLGPASRPGMTSEVSPFTSSAVVKGVFFCFSRDEQRDDH